MNPARDVRISKTQRWLDLIAFMVRHHFPVDVDQVMNGVPAYRDRWNTGDATDKQTVRKMFERDKKELRDAGIPLDTVEFTIDHGAEAVGYQLKARDFYLPYLRLVGESESDMGDRGTGGRRGNRPKGGAMQLEITGEEAETAVEALRRVADLPASPFAAEARSALRKLGFDLDIAALGESPVVYAANEDAMRVAMPEMMADAMEAEGPGEAEDAGEQADAAPPVPHVPHDSHVDVHEQSRVYSTGATRNTLKALTDALRARKRVRFTYHGIQRGAATERDVAPYGLLFHHGHWYLIASDATRDHEIRVFRLGRMEDPEVGKGSSPDYEIPDDFDVSHYARRQPWELGEDEPMSAGVRFEFPLSLWADRNRHGTLAEELPGGATLRRFGVRQAGPFLRWLQQFGGDAVVVEPEGLRRAQVEMARQTLEVYGD